MSKTSTFSKKNLSGKGEKKLAASYAFTFVLGALAVPYTPKKDFLKEIDISLNQLEFPLRSRFYWYRVVKSGMRGEVSIEKALGRSSDSGHLKIVDGDKNYSVKLSTLIRRDQDRVFVKIPLGLEKYKKTWGQCDFILFHLEDYERKMSKLYWVDAKAFLQIIENLKRPQVISWIDMSGTNCELMYTKENLNYGLDVEEDMIKQFKIVKQVDYIDWKTSRIHPTELQFFPLLIKDGGYDFSFKSAENEKLKEAYWPKYQLKNWRDQSRPIKMTVVSNGSEFSFKSTKEASEMLLSVFGFSIHPLKIFKNLHGKQKKKKTISTPRGEIFFVFLDT